MPHLFLKIKYAKKKISGVTLAQIDIEANVSKKITSPLCFCESTLCQNVRNELIYYFQIKPWNATQCVN